MQLKLLTAAFAGGMLARALRLPPIVGYLVGGLVVGPFTPGFSGDSHAMNQLAEVGVMFMMFGTGLHFSFKDLNEDLYAMFTTALADATVVHLSANGALRIVGRRRPVVVDDTESSFIAVSSSRSVCSSITLPIAVAFRGGVPHHAQRLGLTSHGPRPPFIPDAFPAFPSATGSRSQSSSPASLRCAECGGGSQSPSGRSGWVVGGQ